MQKQRLIAIVKGRSESPGEAVQFPSPRNLGKHFLL